MSEKKSFLKRIAGVMRADEMYDDVPELVPQGGAATRSLKANGRHTASTATLDNTSTNWEEAGEGQLSVDVYQTPDYIVIQAMVAGIKPDQVEINISRDVVTIKGQREQIFEDGADFFHQELYWGSFSRTITLPEEIDVDMADASEKYGLLTLRLPKMDKHRQTRVKVKSN